MQILLGKWASMAVSAAAKFGIADHLEGGPKSAQELAKLTGTNEDALYRLLRTTSSLGVFSETEDGRFAQTPLSDTLRTSARPSTRAMAMMLLEDWHMQSWNEIAWSVETGQPAPRKLWDGNLFDWLHADPKRAESFDRAMSSVSTTDAPLIAQAYDYSGFRHLVEIGGGEGKLLATILEQNPNLHGTLFELPEVIESARGAGFWSRIKERCQLQGGSFFESLPDGADAYLMKHILHDWDDPEAGEILDAIRRAARPASKLLIAEWVLSGANEPSPGKLIDLEMLIMPGGRERTEPQWRELLSAHGFRLERVIPVPNQQCLLEATPAT